MFVDGRGGVFVLLLVVGGRGYARVVVVMVVAVGRERFARGIWRGLSLVLLGERM